MKQNLSQIQSILKRCNFGDMSPQEATRQLKLLRAPQSVLNVVKLNVLREGQKHSKAI